MNMAVNIDSIATNPYIALGGLALAIVSILLAVYFYIKSKKEKIPCFEESNNTLIEGLSKSLDRLEIHYKNTIQERITVTKLAFWNAGRDTIDRNNLVHSDPVRVVCPRDIDILDAQVIQVSAKANSVSLNGPINDAETYYEIVFDYLDNRDFFVIQIVHKSPRAHGD